MTTSLTVIKPQSTALTTTDEAGEWMDAARSLTAKSYLGKLLKFSKGDWSLGLGTEEEGLPHGTAAITVVPSASVGWQNFSTGEFIFVPLRERLKLPTRSALGDTDARTWPTDALGKARDPWQKMHTMNLILNGAVVTFSTSSKGGRDALGALTAEYAEALRAGKRGKLPRVELQSDTYKHSTFGKIKTPVFEVVGWQDEESALAILGGGKAPAPRPVDIIDDFPSNLGPDAEEIPWD
jgi:hypothetical protein